MTTAFLLLAVIVITVSSIYSVREYSLLPTSDTPQITIAAQTTAAMIKAEKIKKARKHLVELGYKTMAKFEEATEKMLGHKYTNLSSLSSDELDKLIDFKGEYLAKDTHTFQKLFKQSSGHSQ